MTCVHGNEGSLLMHPLTSTHQPLRTKFPGGNEQKVGVAKGTPCGEKPPASRSQECQGREVQSPSLLPL